MDYSARIFDQHMVVAMNKMYSTSMEFNEYFQDDSFYERAFTHIYMPSDSSMDEANSHLKNLYNLLLHLMNERESL